MNRATALLLIACVIVIASTGSVTAAVSPSAVEPSSNTTFDVSIEYGGNIVPPQSPNEAPDRYEVRVTGAETVTITSPTLHRSRLATMFGGTRTATGVRVPVPENDTLTMTLTAPFDCLPGTYELRFRGASDETATTTLALSEPATFETNLRGQVQTVARGQVAEIPFRIDVCSDTPATLSVRSPNGTWWNVTVDRTGVGESGAVRFATNGTTPRFTQVLGNATIRSRSSTGTETTPLPTGEYDLSMWQRGSQTDVGALAIRPPQDVPTTASAVTRTSTATVTAPPPTHSSTISTATEATTRVTDSVSPTKAEHTATASAPTRTTVPQPASTAPDRTGTTATTTATGDGPWITALALVLALLLGSRRAQ